MALSVQTKLDLGKVLTITIAYVLFSLFLAVYDHVMLGALGANVRPEDYNLTLNLLVHALSGLIAGTLGGYMMMVANRRLFRRNSLGMALLKTAGYFLFVYVVVTVVISTAIGFVQHSRGATITEVLSVVWENVTNPAQLIYLTLWGSIALLTLFLLQVSDKFGPGILRKFLLGQYFHPKEEPRFFMFLDMRSSTNIAEQIGNEAYFNLLRDCFSILTQPIVDSRGEICQYVGDEIVVSWTPARGFVDAICLRCFNAIQRRLKEEAVNFQKTYGLVPEFKAGLHYGEVMAGEIGDIKKDIVYSGDVLNATARIQDLCNHYKEDFLASSQALEQIPKNKAFAYVSIGEIELRGKNERIGIHAVHATV